MTIGLVDPDPYLSLTVTREYPDATVLRVFDATDPGERISHCDLLLVDVNGANAPSAAELADGVPVVSIGRPNDPHRARSFPADAVLLRPYLPQDLRRTVSEVLGGADADGERRPAADLGRRLQVWMGPARVGAIAAAAIVQSAEHAPTDLVDTIALAASFLYVTARLRFLRGTRTGALVDTAVAAALIVATGGYLSNYLAFGFVAAVGSGLFMRSLGAVLAGSFVSLASVPSLVVAFIGGGQARPLDVIVVLLLFPAAALAGGQARRLRAGDGLDAPMVLLQEANRALSSLYRIARDLPRSLTLQSVAQATLDEVAAVVGARASVLFVAESGVVYEVASEGLTEHASVVTEREEFPEELLVSTLSADVGHAVPDTVLEAAPAELTWSVIALPTGSGRDGWVLVGADGRLPATSRRALQRIAREAALSIDNARLFSRVRELAVDEERGRLASDLHDGVAQALAHVRLELEFLSRYGPDPAEGISEDADRLAQVVQRSLADVRSTIADLRAASLSGGLAVAIHDHCRDIRLLAGLTIDVRTRSSVRLDPAAETEIFRIFRSALSNAVRRAGTESVSVLLEDDEGLIRLVIEDDGRSMPERYDRRAGREGAGLRIIRERAAELGADLEVTSLRGGGTRVTLACPIDERTAMGTGT
ncbi:MAG: sensor histidine kinase [Actinobacteria bacterium]|nr:sensor histidine kinase [Actinomycetota bacterium]